MSRKRMIDPDIWDDSKFNQLDQAGKLIFIGMITLANDQGKLRADPRILKSKVFPYNNIDLQNVEKAVQQIADLGMITYYEVAGEHFARLSNWNKYQTLTYIGKDNLPDPEQENLILNQPLTNPEETLNTNRDKRDKLIKYKTECEEFMSHFNAACGKSLSLDGKAGELRLRVISQRLGDGFSLDQLKKAVDNFSTSDWHRERGFVDVVYCIGIRDGKDNLERWLSGPVIQTKPEEDRPMRSL